MKVPKHKGPRWAKAEHDARKQAKQDAAAAHGQGNSVAAIRERLNRLERVLGIVEAAR